MREILKDIYTWSVFSEEKNLNFNGYFIYSDYLTSPNIVIDPPEISEQDLKQIDSLGSVQHILITNRNHIRWSNELKEKYNAPITMSFLDENNQNRMADNYFSYNEILFDFLKAIPVLDNKSPGETALFWEKRKILFIGDALIGKPAGYLSLLPPKKYKDIDKAKKGIQVFDRLNFDSLLLADGDPILSKGKEAIKIFLNN